MLDAKAREALAGIQNKIGTLLARSGVTANVLTALGVVVTALAAWRIVDQAFVVGGVLLIVGGVLDILDGSVARATGTASPLGAFLDSATDRISDALVFGALVWVYARADEPVPLALAIVCLAGAQVTSYIRAKAESMGFTCRVGIAERAERLVVVIAGLILGFLEIALWVLAVAVVVTVLQRLVHVYRQARDAS